MTTLAMTVPLARASPLHIPRRDIELATSDSIQLTVTVVERDSGDADPITLTGGLSGPALRLLVWSAHFLTFDYGGISGSGSLIAAHTAAIGTAPGSFVFALPAGTMTRWPRRCGYALAFTDDGGAEAETLVQGVLNVRAGQQMAADETPLLTDDGTTVLIDGLPTSPPALGGFWNNGGVLCIASGPNALPLPTSAPEQGWWNNNGVVCFV
jgi:hypothetical protein